MDQNKMQNTMVATENGKTPAQRNRYTSKNISIHNLTIMAILAAIAAVLFMLEFPVFPVVPFYKLDFSNLPVLLGAFAMGPVEGVIILLIKALLGLLHTTSGGVGELADFIVGCAMVVPAGLIYHRKKSRLGALLGMLVGTLCAVAAAALANYFIMFPAYSAFISMDQIIEMGNKLFSGVTSTWTFILFVTCSFNLIKFVAISIVGYLIYKPLSPILHGRRKNK
ncbi:MAG: ECF transporter S component [Clostridia bacterium]|nr:ECF transporter S component [Clostridia bacterium]